MQWSFSRPQLHNFNGSLTYFSHNVVREEELFFNVVFIDLYAGLYCSLIAFVAIQFIFRYATLLGHRTLLESFHGPMKFIWLPAVIAPGAMFCLAGLLLMEPDEYSDEYIKQEFHRVYSRDVKNIARLILVAYVRKFFLL
uniref:Na_H_Exchanger domain-containing protein n=1 Tax=Caenorhabditis tropicalis TaxID=1561998 RepID=A0A1I7UVN2_9PELO